MFKMVDGTGIIGVDMICPLGVSTPQPPNYDRVEMEGTGMLVLPNSLDAPLERLELGGKTEQVQTTGKNLLPDKFSIYAEGKSKTNLKLQIGNYVYSSKTSKNLYILHEDKSNITNGWTATNKFNFKIDKEETIEVRIETENPLEILPMIRGETELDSYEPYTGGKPSPSPEYPQKIKNVGKWNEETQKYEVDVKVTGKNLLNLQKEPDVKGLYQGWKVGNGDKGTLSIKDKGNNADISECYFGLNSYGTTSYSVTWLVDNGVIKRYHIESIEKMYACMYPPNETIIKKITERFEIQYEYGSIATEYQPYKEQTLTITSDRPITKWDRLVEQDGQIGWLYSTGAYEDIKESDISANSINDQYGRYYVNAIKTYKNAECMCNIAEYSPAQKEDKCGFWYNDTLCLLIRSEYTGNNGTEDHSTAIKNFKDNVLSKGITVFYKLNTKEFIPLPQSEQNAIRALKTYYPTTVITVDGGELDPDIKVTYRKEI